MKHAGKDNRAKGSGTLEKSQCRKRAQEIAEQVKAEIGSVEGISHVEAVKGYLNLYFTNIRLCPAGSARSARRRRGLWAWRA